MATAFYGTIVMQKIEGVFRSVCKMAMGPYKLIDSTAQM